MIRPLEKYQIVGAAFAVVLSLFVAGLPAAEEEETVAGELQVAEEDDDGNVLSVYLYDSDWGDILVSDSGRGAALREHVGDMVRITGRLEEDEEGSFDWVIFVTGYEVDEERPGEAP